MKIKSIAAICKKNKQVVLFNRYSDSGTLSQYIGDGNAVYPISGLPELDEESILTIFDVPEKQREDWLVRYRDIPEGISFEDTDATEKIIEQGNLSIVYILDEMKRDKIISYHRTRARFEEIDRVVKLFAERKEFHVIRMYYFGEDAQGNERPTGAEPYTWEAIAAELEGMGLIRDAKSARRWRNKIVNDMAVCMFGKPAAVGVGTYRKERDRG